MGGKQAGCIGLLALSAKGHNVKVVVYDPTIEAVAYSLGLDIYYSIKNIEVDEVLVCVHGREIVPIDVLRQTKLAINVHPFLWKYKGKNPVERALMAGETKASVGVHYMTEYVDMGETIVEDFIDITGLRTVPEVYNVLYPMYATTLLRGLKRCL